MRMCMAATINEVRVEMKERQAAPVWHALECAALALELSKVPLAAALGLACVVGAATLAWFSSPATLHLARGDQGLATAALESRTFGLITNRAERIEGIRAASLLRTRTGRSHTPDTLLFQTTSGSVDLGRNQQLFAVDYPAIDSFFQDEASQSLTLSSIARGRELIRFLVAQAIFLFLLLVGLGVEWMVVRSILGADQASRSS